MAAVDALDRLIAAIEAGDLEAARVCYAEGARIWHNHDEVFQTVDQKRLALSAAPLVAVSCRMKTPRPAKTSSNKGFMPR